MNPCHGCVIQHPRENIPVWWWTVKKRGFFITIKREKFDLNDEEPMKNNFTISEIQKKLFMITI